MTHSDTPPFAEARLDLRRLDESALAAALQQYDKCGFLALEGFDELTARFRHILRVTLGVDEDSLTRMLSSSGPPLIFDRDTRQRVARVGTPPDLAATLLRDLEPIIAALLGPFVHVSSTFHAQFKGGAVQAVDHGGYRPDADYMEVHGRYLLHQDFAGGNLPTSPSAATLWVGMNSVPDWKLHLYPGTHRRGLLCNTFVDPDDERVKPFGVPVAIAAREGEAVLFNAMLLHGTGQAGTSRRVSCDIRFFPLCGFLPSRVHLLGSDPLESLNEQLRLADGDTLRAPLLETRAFLGYQSDDTLVAPHSVLNWAYYVTEIVQGSPDTALPYLRRLVNEEDGVEPPDVYIAKFHGRPVHAATLRQVREELATSTSAAALAPLDRAIARCAETWS